MFLMFGIPIMLTTFIADCVYFWVNMFRKNLKKIVIEREQSTVTNFSIKQIGILCSKFAAHRVKALQQIDLVK